MTFQVKLCLCNANSLLTDTIFPKKRNTVHLPEQMKPENALPAYLYCKLVSTFQPGGKNRGKTAPPGKSGGRERERVEKPALARETHKSSGFKKKNKAQQHQQTALNTNYV